jgi:hypothetical protein
MFLQRQRALGLIAARADDVDVLTREIATAAGRLRMVTREVLDRQGIAAHLTAKAKLQPDHLPQISETVIKRRPPLLRSTLVTGVGIACPLHEDAVLLGPS